MRIAGRAIDRYGAARVSVVGTAVMIGVLYFAFIAPGAIGVGGVLVVFVLFMGGHVDPQRQHELAVDARAARRPARRLHVAAVDRAAHLVGDRARSCRHGCCTRRPAAASRGSRRCPSLSAVLALGLPPLLAAIGKRVSAERELRASWPPACAGGSRRATPRRPGKRAGSTFSERIVAGMAVFDREADRRADLGRDSAR